MPYVKTENREELDDLINELVNKIIDKSDEEKEGILNYTITNLVVKSMIKNNKRYFILNRIIGIFECAKLEVYRRLVASYEDEAIKKNGDLEFM